jgi:peptide/nickel transport system substrate-binding protein
LKGKGYVRVLALVGVLAVTAAACGGGGENPSPTGSAPSGPTGSATIAVEQWPQCTNPIVTGCASASWAGWAIYNMVFPKAMVFDPDTGVMTNTSLLTEAPSTDAGTVKETSGGGMQVTFKINPEAKWDDGTPITSKDFEFTAKAMEDTKGSYYAAGLGFEYITKVDTTDPQTAVVTYKQIFADWPDEFGGLTEVLKASAYDSTDISKVEKDSIEYSGAPWKLQSWSKSQEVLVPNTNYWVKEDIPKLAKVIMVPREDQTTEINSILSGEADAASPQPSNVSIVKQIASNPDIKAFAAAAAGGYYEAHWLNDEDTWPAENGKPNPLADKQVRLAYMYAVNRDEIIKGLIQLNQPDAEVLNCGLLAFPGTPYCQVTPFDKYNYDPQKSLQILEADGWNCSSKPCTKNGMTLNLLYATVAGNARRETTQELLKNSIKAAGFDYTFKNAEATNLFGNVAPHGDFQVSDFAQGATIDPSGSGTLSCASVPTKANGYGGGNFDRWCDPQFDKLLSKADQQLEQSKRVAIENQIMQYEADNAIFLPLYVLPQMLVYNSSKIASTEDINKWVPTPQGAFWGVNHWYLVGS